VALARGRERVRVAERAAQEAGFAERSCRDRLAELARRRETLEAQLGQQQLLLTRVTTEREGIDWTPVEAALQTQLNARAATEQALATARDQQEALDAGRVLEPVTGDDGGHERRDGDEYRVHPEDLRKQRARAHPPGTSAPLASGLMVEGPHGAAIISEALNPDRLSRTSV